MTPDGIDLFFISAGTATQSSIHSANLAGCSAANNTDQVAIGLQSNSCTVACKQPGLILSAHS